MKTRKLVPILLLVLSFGMANAQEVFKVIANKGVNSVKKGSSSKPLMTGLKLYNDESVIVSAGGYVSLVHTSGKTMELKTPGTYTVKELSTKVGAASTTTTQKYGQFVYGQLTTQATDVNSQYKTSQTTTGAVMRATGNNAISSFSPLQRANMVSDPNVKLTWEPLAGVSTYVVTVTDMNGSELQKIETSETTTTVDVRTYNLGDDMTIIWNVSSKADPAVKSNNFMVTVISDQSTLDMIKDTQSNFSDESSVNYFLKGVFYEDKGMFTDAAAAYKMAMTLSPDVDAYKDAYNNLLKKEGLDSFVK